MRPHPNWLKYVNDSYFYNYCIWIKVYQDDTLLCRCKLAVVLIELTTKICYSWLKNSLLKCKNPIFFSWCRSSENHVIGRELPIMSIRSRQPYFYSNSWCLCGSFMTWYLLWRRPLEPSPSVVSSSQKPAWKRRKVDKSTKSTSPQSQIRHDFCSWFESPALCIQRLFWVHSSSLSWFLMTVDVSCQTSPWLN